MSSHPWNCMKTVIQIYQLYHNIILITLYYASNLSIYNRSSINIFIFVLLYIDLLYLILFVDTFVKTLYFFLQSQHAIYSLFIFLTFLPFLINYLCITTLPKPQSKLLLELWKSLLPILKNSGNNSLTGAIFYYGKFKIVGQPSLISVWIFFKFKSVIVWSWQSKSICLVLSKHKQQSFSNPSLLNALSSITTPLTLVYGLL